MKKRLLFTSKVVFLLILFTRCSNAPDIKYEILRTDNRDPIINLDVFIQDTTQLVNLNNLLNTTYNSGKDKFITFQYFDDKEIAKSYHDKVFDSNTSAEELDKLVLHRIAVYNFNPKTNFDKLER